MATGSTSSVAGVRQHLLAGATLRTAAPPVTLAQLVRDCLWILFFIVASYGASPLQDYGVERLAWFAADFVALAMILLRPEEMLRQVRENLVILSWPLLACVSAVWSLTPGITLYHGVQLLATVLVALCLVETVGLRRILVLVFIALLITANLSVQISLGGTDEWKGVFPHKNVLGNMMAVQVITGVSLFLAGWRRSISGAGIIFALGLLAMSRSGTAIVAVTMVLALALLAQSVRGGAVAVGIIFGLVLIAASGTVITFELLNIDLFDLYASVLNALGKDETLTGRTVLWQFAEDAIQSRPWLGYGYKGWWESTETPATLLRLIWAQEIQYFHNTFLDLAVAFGVLGPSVLVAGLIVGVYRSVRAYVSNPEPVLLWPMLFVALSIVYCSVDFILFTNHSFHQFLFVVAIVPRTRRRQP